MMRGPTAREKRIALAVGLTLHRRLDGTWAARDAKGWSIYVINGTDSGWRRFRRFVAPLIEVGFRF